MRATSLLCLALAIAACGEAASPTASLRMTAASGGGVTLSIPDTLWSDAVNIMAPPYVYYPPCDLPLETTGSAAHYVSGRVRYSPFPLPIGFAVLYDVAVDSATLAARLGTAPGAGTIFATDAPSPYPLNYTVDVLLRWREDGTGTLDSARVFARCLRRTIGDAPGGGEVLEG